MKHYISLAWMMAVAIAGTTLTACSLDGDEPSQPILIIDPVEETQLAICGISPAESRSADGEQLLFTEHDIEWFNATTREIKFFDMQSGKPEICHTMYKEPYKIMQPYREIKFYLGGDALFVVSSFVSDVHSMVFTDLVLHYDVISDPGQGHYYLHDCYPPQFIDTDEVKANIRKNADQWLRFTDYLASKGKLRR